MKFIDDVSPEKLRGGYYTPEPIASFLLRWVLEKNPKSILEPSCGDGVFFRVLKNLAHKNLRAVLGVELLSSEADKAYDALDGTNIENSKVLQGNFLEWFLAEPISMPRFDSVVGNPPFIRYQYLKDNQQDLAKAIFEQFNLDFTRHTNAWVPFVIASLALLNPGGRFAMVLPSELLHILHSASLRKHMATVCSRILIIDPKELWFEDTLQGAILVLAEKKQEQTDKSYGVSIVDSAPFDILKKSPEEIFRSVDYVNGDVIKGKWMKALLDPEERTLLSRLQEEVPQFAEVADVSVGIVTGANKFFLVPDDVVAEFDLAEWAYPVFGRSENVPGAIYDKRVHKRNREAGLSTNLLWFRDVKKEDLPPRVQKYIGNGEALNLHHRYKCRIREPWFEVPYVYSTGVGMLKRAHNFPRLVLNKINAFTTDTVYRISSNGTNPNSLVFSFVNSLTALSAELEGRHYGGGVLELVPSEIRNLFVPLVQAGSAEVGRLDEILQQNKGAKEILEAQDDVVLSQYGLTKRERLVLLSAWYRLRNRRQRN